MMKPSWVDKVRVGDVLKGKVGTIAGGEYWTVKRKTGGHGHRFYSLQNVEGVDLKVTRPALALVFCSPEEFKIPEDTLKFSSLSIRGITPRRYGSETSRPRVFFHPEGGLLIKERFNQPYRLYRTLLPEALEKAGWNVDVPAKWSQLAGCHCGCSPGFLLDDPDHAGQCLHVDVGENEMEKKSGGGQVYAWGICGAATSGEKELAIFTEDSEQVFMSEYYPAPDEVFTGTVEELFDEVLIPKGDEIAGSKEGGYPVYLDAEGLDPADLSVFKELYYGSFEGDLEVEGVEEPLGFSEVDLKFSYDVSTQPPDAGQIGLEYIKNDPGYAIEDYEVGQLCPYCNVDLSFPEGGWYLCGNCRRALYAEEADSDYEDFAVWKEEEWEEPPPKSLIVAKVIEHEPMDGE